MDGRGNGQVGRYMVNILTNRVSNVICKMNVVRTCAMVRGNVMELESVGTKLGAPLRRMPWSSAAAESLARRAEMAWASKQEWLMIADLPSLVYTHKNRNC